MNKKLEAAMLAESNNLFRKFEEATSTVFADSMVEVFESGFQKCHELMAEREAKLVEALNKIMSDEEEYSPTFFKLEKALKERGE